MHRTGRGVLGNKAASGTEIIQELGEEHQRTGKWIVYTSADSVFQVAAHEETIPLDELYARLRDRARDPHRQARRRPRDRPPVHRRAGELHAHAEPARLLARAKTAELPDAASGRRREGARRREDRRHLRRRRHRRVASDEVERRRGSPRRSACSASSDDGTLVFVNLVETDMLWGHRNDPVNFHRCLQDFDRRLTDILDALRAGRPARADLGPRLRPDDARRPTTRASTRSCSRTRRAETRTAHVHEGEFADVGATVNAWLGGKAPGRGIPGRRSSRRERSTTRRVVRGSTRTSADCSRAARLRTRTRRARTPREVVVRRRSPRPSRRRVLEVGCGPGELAARIADGARRDCRRPRRVAAHGRARTQRGASTRGVGDVQELPFADGVVRLRRRRLDALSTSPTSTAALAELARVLRPGGRLVAVTNGARPPRGAARAGRAARASGAPRRRSAPRTAADAPGAPLRDASSGETPPARIDVPGPRDGASRTSTSSIGHAISPSRVPAL